MNRIESVDIFRLLAIIAVIAIHCRPFDMVGLEKQSLYNYLEILINQTSRFAVPFFFIISGYFYGKKYKASTDQWRVTKDRFVKILSLFLFWSLVYCLPYNISLMYEGGLSAPINESYKSLTSIFSRPLDLLFEGTKVHLWFLNALALSVMLSYILIRYTNVYILIGIALSLYIFGVVSGSYSKTIIGIEWDFNTRNGPFFALPSFVMGYMLTVFRPQDSWLYKGVILWFLATIVSLLEVYYNYVTYDIYAGQDYVFATPFMGLGAAMVALSNHRFLQCKSLSMVGQMTFGVYAIHYVFIDLLTSFYAAENYLVWEISQIFVVLVLSIVSVKMLQLNKYLNKYAV